MTSRFKKQLIQQIHFLKNSCDLFDRGQLNEAIRIATSIRVIVHDTKNSTSLLSHLNSKRINIFTTYSEPSSEEGYSAIHMFNMGIISMGNGKYGYGPNLEEFIEGVSEVLPIDKWWTQIVWRLDTKSFLSRRDIILTAANQDGGAHVDENLNGNYKKLAEEVWGNINIKKGPTCLNLPIINMHFVALRTIANELLQSPEFLKLLK